MVGFNHGKAVRWVVGFVIGVSLGPVFEVGKVLHAARPEPQRITNFALLDNSGRHFELRRSGARAVVLYFTGFGCPIARQSVPKLQALQKEFASQGVQVWMINAMPQQDPDPRVIEYVTMMFAQGQMEDLLKKHVADPEETARRIRAFGNLSQVLPKSMVMGDRAEFLKIAQQATVGDLTLLRDEQQLVTRQLGITRTCEAIVVEPQSGEIIYRGAVDDQMTPGAQKPAASEHYLRDAVKNYLAGEKVEVTKTPAQGCLIAFAKPHQESSYTYREHVAPLLERKCVQCHNAKNIGPFALAKYDDVVTWSAMIAEVVMDRRMPPWDADPHYGTFTNNNSLSAAEAHGLLHWIREGCPREEGSDPLAEIEIADQPWPMGTPDLIMPLPEPQEIPATGLLDYRYVTSTVEVPQDVWVRAVVCRPGDPKVVHHMIVRPIFPAGYKDISEEAYLLSTWAPGVPQREFPEGTGVFLPKGTKCHFELHYTTDGVPHVDRSELGFYYAKEPPMKKLEVRVCETRDLNIPPGEENAVHRAFYCFKRDATLYNLGPHMHLRGDRFQFILLTPDGKREVLLSVPRYDFNWQIGHVLSSPKQIPAGSWLVCEGAFDNSKRNPFNPDPTKFVHWGLQTTDEMFMGFVYVAEDR